MMKMNLQYFAEDETQEEVDTQEEETQEVTLTQDEVNRLVAQNKSKAKDEAEKNFEKQLQEVKDSYESQLTEIKSKLGEKDREAFDLQDAKNEIEKLQQQLEEERNEKQSLSAKITHANIKDKAISKLNEKGLSTSDEMLEMVVKDNAEDTVNAIEAIEKLLSDQRKQDAQTDAPRQSGGTGKSNTGKGDMFSILDDAKQTPL